MAFPGSNIVRRTAVLVNQVRVSSSIKEHSDNLHMASIRCTMERRVAIPISQLQVGTGTDESTDSLQTSSIRSGKDRRPALLRSIAPSCDPRMTQ